jgi:AP-3 complex subunit beta
MDCFFDDIVQLMAKGRSVTDFFPLVTNCLSSPSLTLRSLVSLYIIRQAALDPDVALLAVNTYQKDLTDSNPVIRGMALRVLSGMGLNSIAGLVVMSLRKCSRDGSWYVRRMVAVGVEKTFRLLPLFPDSISPFSLNVFLARLDPAHLSSLLPILSTLLADHSGLVVGSACAAFDQICPARYDLIHPHYRHLCRSLFEGADEWGQVAIIKVLLRYARTHFLDPNRDPVCILSTFYQTERGWSLNPA